MATRELLHDGGGIAVWLDTSGNQNEIHIDQKAEHADDATAVRMGMYGPNCKVSFDFLSGPDNDPNNAPRRSERIMIEVARDDDPSAQPDAAIAKLYAQTQPVGSETDAGEILLLSACAREIEARVPLRASAGIVGATPSSAKVTRFYSDDGRYCYNVQGDAAPGAPNGRLVVYATNGSTNETTWAAVGTIALEPLP